MAILGCTNTNAANYDPSATEDDGSCVYLAHVGGICYAFEDEGTANVKDESFTLSLSIKGGMFVFYHDYLPDYYFHTRTKLHHVKDGKVYRHNDGPPGVFHDGTPKPFFMDVVVKANPNSILNSVGWLTEVFSLANGQNLLDTFTHVTIWNEQQCTGRIPLVPFDNITADSNSRLTRSTWVFNQIQNAVINEGSVFLMDIFKDYRPIAGQLDTTQQRSWYEVDYLRGDYFILRLETDNVNAKKLFFHDYIQDATPDVRF
jgi:hypothetical protein